MDKISEQLLEMVAKPEQEINLYRQVEFAFKDLLCVHEVVNYWVDGRVSHGEPEEG